MNDGGPAFPPGYDPDEKGMSLRDYFAAQVEIKQWELEKFMFREPTEQLLCEWEAALRYIKADALLKERERNQQSPKP